MGQPKALLRIGPDTFVSRVTRALIGAGASPVVIVAGAEVEAVRAAVSAEALPVAVVQNPHRERGQLSSIFVGLDAVDGPDVGAVLVCLVDCPLVSADTIARVMAAHRATGAPIVRPVMGGRHGHPVLFSRKMFAELRGTDLAVGAKAVVRAHASEAVDVEVSDAGAVLDIDTPDDYERYIKPESHPATSSADTGSSSYRCAEDEQYRADKKKARTPSELS
jgi:molybdenum cofactor cytidylyltransferase